MREIGPTVRPSHLPDEYHGERQYQALLSDLLKVPTIRGDRTGVGTRALFGRRMEFDLADGFPLLTTKKMFFKGAVVELLWFLSGSTDVRDLQRRGVHFWDEWQGDDGTIGLGYGAQMRDQRFWRPVKPKIYEPEAFDVVDEDRTVFGVGYYGACNSADPSYEMLVTVWREMLRRCYYEKSENYPGYGGAGVHVDNRWHCFANFQRDAKKLPNWNLKIEYPTEYSIDKDTLWASNRYAPHTAMWADDVTQNANRSNTAYFTARNPAGEEVWFTSIGEAKRQYGLNLSAVHRCLHGKLHTHHGWSDFRFIHCAPGEALRFTKVDQIKSIFAGLKHDPYGRRHVLTLWNPADLGRTTLPPCHGSVIQFFVEDDGRLSCQMVQRSADAFLGLPVNIASYALLTSMFAKALGRTPGRFIWTGGDVHLYANHEAQAAQQLFRQPRPFPTLELAERADLDSWQLGDFTLKGYQPHAHIAAEVAV